MYYTGLKTDENEQPTNFSMTHHSPGIRIGICVSVAWHARQLGSNAKSHETLNSAEVALAWMPWSFFASSFFSFYELFPVPG